MDILEHNRSAWNRQSQAKGEWSTPVTAKQLESAKQGEWEIILTPEAKVPRSWFGELKGKQLLGLASGGGQQMPILAAAGAIVTCIDNSDEQLAKDQQTASDAGLNVDIYQGDMADLSIFADGQFDVIFHPVSNVFVPDVNKVWNECFRVLKPGGRLLAGFMNPAMFMFDHDKAEATGKLDVEFTLPYSDLTAGEQRKQNTVGKGHPVEFSHSLDSQLGGQIAAGFTLQGFYEDQWSGDDILLSHYMPVAMATLAMKPV